MRVSAIYDYRATHRENWNSFRMCVRLCDFSFEISTTREGVLLGFILFYAVRYRASLRAENLWLPLYNTVSSYLQLCIQVEFYLCSNTKRWLSEITYLRETAISVIA